MSNKYLPGVLLLLLVKNAWSFIYPQNVINSFYQACTGSGGTERSCVCQINAYQSEISFPQFLQMDTRIRMGMGEPSDFRFMKEVVDGCNNQAIREYTQDNARLIQENQHLDRQNAYWDRELQRQKRKSAPKY